MTYTNHSGHNILKGNDNTYVENVESLDPPIIVSKIRFIPHSDHPRTVCMRVEVYGCKYETGLVSYTAPPGDEFSPHAILGDVYDGISEAHINHGGLGILTDGQIGRGLSFSQRGIGAGKQRLKDSLAGIVQCNIFYLVSFPLVFHMAGWLFQ